VKGRRPRPLDEGRGPRAYGAVGRPRDIKGFDRGGKQHGGNRHEGENVGQWLTVDRSQPGPSGCPSHVHPDSPMGDRRRPIFARGNSLIVAKPPATWVRVDGGAFGASGPRRSPRGDCSRRSVIATDGSLGTLNSSAKREFFREPSGLPRNRCQRWTLPMSRIRH
jgi:hypothetical protein